MNFVKIWFGAPTKRNAHIFKNHNMQIALIRYCEM